MRSVSPLLIVLALVACDKEPAPAASAPAAPAEPAMVSEHASSSAAITGKVLEATNAASYTYLRLETSLGEVWAAVPETKKAVGETVTLENPTPMKNFTSPTLKRTFDTILFATLAGEAVAAPVAAPAHAAASAPVANIAVEKATGPDARTVAEVWAQKAALKGQKVTVRAMVVKATDGVMGKNWLHLRDGTGSEATKDLDLTVTSANTASVGDVVTVSGVVQTDKDLGAGYTYEVLVEDALVIKEGAAP